MNTPRRGGMKCTLLRAHRGMTATQVTEAPKPGGELQPGCREVGPPPRPRPLLPAEGSLKRAEDRQQIEDRGHGQVQMEL